MKIKTVILALALLVVVVPIINVHAKGKLKVLLIDGQNNHDWKSCQPILKWILESSGRFSVDVSTTPPAAPVQPRPAKGELSAEQKIALDKATAQWKLDKEEYDRSSPGLWKQWRPRFSQYDVIVSNYNGDPWPEEVRNSFVQYVRNGGGLVIVHAADNSFPEWLEYNEMIGVGGWGNRNEKSGPMVRWRDGKVVLDNTPGAGGTHGPQHEFVVESRDPMHPIMKGLPPRWLHAMDELYSKMRGPAKNITVLATAFAAPEKKGTGEHEPMLMTIRFSKGRVFHTLLGHGPVAMAGLGFQVTLQRGTEWAATGKVSLPAPKPVDLPVDRVAVHEPPK